MACEAAARTLEALVISADCLVVRPRDKHTAALGHRSEPPVVGRWAEGRDLEEPVAIRGPADCVQQAVLSRLIVAIRDGSTLDVGPQVPGGNRDDGIAKGPKCAQPVLDDPGGQ